MHVLHSYGSYVAVEVREGEKGGREGGKRMREGGREGMRERDEGGRGRSKGTREVANLYLK